MPQPLLGAIGFETDRASWISKIIRFFTRSQWSHVFIVAAEDLVTGKREILEADWQGIQKAFLDKYQGKHIKVALYQVNLPLTQRIDALAACMTLVGRSYGYLQLVGLALILPLRWVGIYKTNPISSGRVCSELALRYLQQLEVDYRFEQMDRDSTTPQDLFAIIEEHEAFQRIEV
jgi:hypothetical protein